MIINRRVLFQMGLAAALPMALLEKVLAQTGGTPRIRQNIEEFAKSPEKVAALRAGVARMKQRSVAKKDDPEGWYYWASVHGTTEAVPANLGSLYNSCHHGTLQFVSWHRAFLYFFEQVLKSSAKEAGNQTAFELPYWNWNASPKINAVFTEGDASTNPLWHPRARTDLSNVNISRAWSKASAKPFNAFSSSLEGNPHGTVHGAVGGEMGFVNSSARDPIFWLHHANIDRLWDVWVRLADGRQNPSATSTWAKQKHSFDTTASKVLTTADLIDSRGQLGYIYDDYEIEPITTSVVVASEPFVIAGGQVASPGESGHAMVPDGVEKSDGNKGLKTLSFRRDIALGGRSVVVDLPVAPDAGSALTTFAIEPEKSAIKSAWLVLEDVRIGSDGKLGGFSYDIKLKKKNAGGSQDVVLGTLNTFTLSALKHSPGMAHTGGGHGTSGDAGTLRLPISDALRQLGVTGTGGALQALSVEFESSIPESADKQYLNVGNIRIETSTLPIE